MESTSTPVSSPKSASRSGCLAELGWFASGAVLPMGSFSYYRMASQRSVGKAILFFFVFTVVIAFLSTTALGIPLLSMTQDIRDAYSQGKMPEIVIQDGVARVDGQQPMIFADDRTSDGAMLVAIDTTGEMTSIDRSRYTVGVLLTRTELHLLNNDGEYQIIALSDLHGMFNRNPIVLNGETVPNAWVTFTIIFTVMMFLFLVLWNSVVRLMFIAMVALVIWGIASLIRPKIGFGPFIIGGLYAVVPAIYLSYLFGRIGVGFLGLQTALLMIFWAVALTAVLAPWKFFSIEKPARLWTAALGIPMLGLFIADMFIASPSLYWKAALWIVALLTGFVLIGLRLFFHIRDMKKQIPSQDVSIEPA